MEKVDTGADVQQDPSPDKLYGHARQTGPAERRE